MHEKISKPFYFHPPWNILFNLEMIEKTNPWEINLSHLLLSFLDEMKKQETVDFRASGMVLDSSATIYLLKSQLLLKLEEPPMEKRIPKLGLVPPPLNLPLRYELTTTTMKNLLEALEKALKTESFHSKKPVVKTVFPDIDIVPSINAYLLEIEEQMRNLLIKINSIIKKDTLVKFSSLITGLEKLEQIRTFIILLFLANKDQVRLWQKEEIKDIYITVKGT